MQFPYFLFPYKADPLEAKEATDQRLHTVEDKDTWARADAQDCQMQCSTLIGSRLISTSSWSPTRVDH